MKNNSCNDISNEEPKTDVNMARNCRPEPAPIIENTCKNTCININSSLLFFFLILVSIFKQSNCGICDDTLLMFFLLLVILFNNNGLSCGCD